jgi:hypothetical protein
MRRGNISPIPSLGSMAITNIGETIAPKPPPKPVFERPIASAARTVIIVFPDVSNSFGSDGSREKTINNSDTFSRRTVRNPEAELRIHFDRYIS